MRRSACTSPACKRVSASRSMEGIVPGMGDLLAWAEESLLLNVATRPAMRNRRFPHCRPPLSDVWLRDSYRPLNLRSYRVLRLLLAATHLLALGIGLGAVWARS